MSGTAPSMQVPPYNWREDCRRLLRRNLGKHCRTRTCAFVLCTGGWALTWAEGVSWIEFCPVWMPAAAFYLGLALVPFACLGQRSSGSSARPSDQIQEQKTEPVRDRQVIF